MMTRNAGTRFINKEKIKDKNMMITKNYIAKGEGANRSRRFLFRFMKQRTRL